MKERKTMIDIRKASSFPACLAAVEPNVLDGMMHVAGRSARRDAEEAMRRIDIVDWTWECKMRDCLMAEIMSECQEELKVNKKKRRLLVWFGRLTIDDVVTPRAKRNGGLWIRSFVPESEGIIHLLEAEMPLLLLNTAIVLGSRS